MALYEVSLLYYQMTANTAAKKKTKNESEINNWNNCSKCLKELIRPCIFLHDQMSYEYDLR